MAKKTSTEKTFDRPAHKKSDRFVLVGQFMRFALVGVLNTAVDLAVLNLLIWLSGFGQEGVWYAVFKAISFTVAVINSYLLNKYWVFESRKKGGVAVEFSQFLLVSVIGAFVNVGIAFLVATYVPSVLVPVAFWPSVAALCGTAGGLLWNFFGYKLVVFKVK